LVVQAGDAFPIAAFLGQLQLYGRFIDQYDPGCRILKLNEALHLWVLGMCGSLPVLFKQRVVSGEQARSSGIVTI